jgi:hypothetical protein
LRITARRFISCESGISAGEFKRSLGRQVDGRPGGKAFRAQLVVPEQRQLYDYWLELAKGGGLPSRAEFSPTRLPRLLPGISLVEVADPLDNCRIRLAGTRLREIYDREITGQCIGELGWGEKRDYWLEAYRRTALAGEPTQGVLQGPMLGKEHVVQYWLKLPLRTTGANVGMVLCFDYYVPASELVQDFYQAS